MHLLRFVRAPATVAVLGGLCLNAAPPAGETAASSTTADDVQREVVTAWNATGLRLFAALGGKTANLVLSPYSIGLTMSMALSGARGETAEEMGKILHLQLPRERLDAACADILDRMDRLGKQGGVTLCTANALCLTLEGALVNPAYRELLRTRYSAEIFHARDVGPINAWVARRTHGKIDGILRRLSPNSVCVLLNAVYFKGLWASRFDKRGTRPGRFYVNGDRPASVLMMHQTGRFSVVRRKDFAAVALPYKTKTLAMVIVLPVQRGGLPRLEEKLTIEELYAVFRELRESSPMEAALSLPKFRIESAVDLKSGFQAIGMSAPFSPREADFGGITGRPGENGLVWIAQIRHKAFLEVAEEGTEAAASTAVEFMLRAMPVFIRFDVDHPFLFFVVDSATDAVLFMGRVTNPAAAN